MKFLIAIAVMLMLFAGKAKGDVTKTVGSGGNYATLKAAFDAINAGTVKTGVITLQIISGTTETASAVLNGSGTGASNYTSVQIYPTGTGNYTISNTGNWATIDLNGADNVTIDGRIGMTGTTTSLTITGTNTGNGAAVIRFLNSAENNTIKYCTVTGSSASSSMGVFSFAGSSAGNGNDNNVVEYCNITSSGINRPYNAILSAGTTGRENSGIIIRNNNIYSTFQTGVSSNAININSASIGFTISGNSIYETTAFVTTASASLSYNAIRVSTINEHTITGNYIGGSLPQCGGTPWSFLARHVTYFCGIYAYAGATATTISNNTIANIDFSSKEDNPWDGIFLYAGNFEVSGNTIGAATGNGSIICRTPSPVATATMSGGVVTGITLVNGGSDYSTTAPVITFSTSGSTTPATATATVSGGIVTGLTLISGGAGYTSTPSVIFDGQSNNYSTSHGMIQNSTGTVNITGNNIGSITTVGSDFYSHGFESIYVRTIAATTTLTNNLIGSLTTANSINVSSAAASSLVKQDVYGIYSSSTLTTTISGNTVANLTNAYAGTNGQSRTRGIQTTAGINIITNNTVFEVKSASLQTATGSAASVIGISQTTSTIDKTQTVTGNTVYNLSSSSGTLAVHVYGIYYAGPSTGANSVSGNFVHSLTASSNSIGATINGIVINSGLVTCANNIVSLGGTSLGHLINGIWDGTSTGNNVSFYFNTVYIGGSVSSGATSNTAGLWNANNTSTRNYRNNIFYNARTGGTSGIHHAIRVAGTDGLTIGYNDYAGPLSGITLNTAPDNNSVTTNPSFTLAGGTSAINYYPSATLPGVSGTGITTDYYNITRSSTPKMGALEQNGNVWQGATSTDFNAASNWTNNEVPATGADIIFATSPTNDCYLDADRIVGNITNGSSKNLVVNGKTLTVNGSLSFTSSGKINTSTASSVVKFAGSATQTIQAAAFSGNSVLSLLLDNTNGLTQNGDLTISEALTLTNGALAVGANTLTISGTLTRTNGSINASNSGATLEFANASAIALPASVFSTDITNLTISGAGGLTAGGDITVNGVLNLAAANPSATKGLLEMVISYVNYPGTTITQYLNSYLLNMGANATTIGIGDVTGTVKRTTIDANTDYTFGNQYTTISLTPGTMPSALAVSITIGTTPGLSTQLNDIIRDAIKRTYEIVPTGGSGCYVTANFHYLDTELTSSNSPYHVNTEQKLTTMDYDIDINGHGYPYSDEHGRANYDYINNYIGLSSVPISYFIQIPSTHEWRTIFTLRDYGEGYFTWDGSQNTTTWNDAANWTVGVSGSGIPTTAGHVIIPNAGTTPFDPVLPSGNTIINTISIENGGVLTMGSSTLTIQNSFSGGWEDQNPQGNDPGTSTVVFNRPNTTISGNARFYNVQIAAIDAITDTIADITNQTGSTMKIGGAITKTGLGTGKWYADVFGATVEYNGVNQTILLPDGSLRYHNLILSGTGTKTLPSGLSMHGDFIITGSTEAVAGGTVATVGTMSVGPLAKYTAGAHDHSNGNLIISSDATGTGSLLATTAFSGTVERYIPNELKWHFLSSPVSAQAIWPEFAPTPVYDVDHYVFDQRPYNWDFYYWNPNADTSNQLYWVNLRKNSNGDYNDWSVDAVGSYAGYGASVPPTMTVGRGYLTAYGADWSIPSGSPVTHDFTGTLNYGNQSLNLLNGAKNSFNLVGNPYPSAIDWKAASGWGRSNLATSSGGGYDYWIYNDVSGNYGVFNSSGTTGTHGTTKDIAPMQAFFVKASAPGAVTMTSAVQLHSSQTWLKEGSESLNVLRFKLTTKANPYFDEMNLEVDPGLANDGSQKFWSMHAEAPEIYTIRNGGYYSIERRSAVDDQTVIPIGIRAGISTSYTLQTAGTESFFYAKNIMLEDLKTGAVQDLKTTPSYTFTATPGDAPERFHLRFSGPYGVDEMEKTSPVKIYTYGNDLVVKSNTPEPVTGDVYLCNLPGQQVFTQRIDGAVTRMTLNLPAGCYIATLVTQDRIFSQKVIVN